MRTLSTGRRRSPPAVPPYAPSRQLFERADAARERRSSPPRRRRRRSAPSRRHRSLRRAPTGRRSASARSRGRSTCSPEREVVAARDVVDPDHRAVPGPGAEHRDVLQGGLLPHPRLVGEAGRVEGAEGGHVDAVVDAVERRRCRRSVRSSTCSRPRCRRLFPDASVASVPEVSLRAYATRRPAVETPVFVTVTADGARRPGVAARVARDGAQRVRAVQVAARVPASSYGAVTSSAPTLMPSTRNWTPATATLSVAVALTVRDAGKRCACGRSGDRHVRQRRVGGDRPRWPGSRQGRRCRRRPLRGLVVVGAAGEAEVGVAQARRLRDPVPRRRGEADVVERCTL